MKILFFSDQHLRETGSFPPFNKISSKGLTLELENMIKGWEFIADLIRSESPDLVINGGDIFHLTESQTARTLHGAAIAHGYVSNACRDVGAKFYGIPGQHDIVNEAHMITSIKPFDHYYDQMFYEQGILEFKDYLIYFIPFTSSDGRLYDALLNGQEKGDLLVAHADFKGFHYENGHPSQSNISPELTKPCLAGDLHVKKSMGSVHYPGSLVQHRFSQGSLRYAGGALTFDTETSKVKTFRNTYSKHYIKVRENLDKALALNPEHVVLQVVHDLPREEIAEIFKDFDHHYLPAVKQSEMELEGASAFALEEPEELLAEFIREDRPEVMPVYHNVMKGRDRG